MSQPRNERKRRAQQLRTRRHEAKRRAVRNAYRPRTVGRQARRKVYTPLPQIASLASLAVMAGAISLVSRRR